MVSIQLAYLLNLACLTASGDVTPAPHLTVLDGSVRVLAGETWLSLARGAELPESRTRTTLSLDWNACARLTVAGAGVDLRGPLEVESTLDGEWTLRLTGGGEAQVNARAIPIHIELASTARLDLQRGVYWLEGTPAGGWRVACDAGEPPVVRAPSGIHWGRSPRVERGASLLLEPAGVSAPLTAGAGRKLVAPPWTSFSWPWTTPGAGN